MAYICYRAMLAPCKTCKYLRFDAKRGEQSCFGGQESTAEEQQYHCLEWLRRRGNTNAAPYLMKEFGLDYNQAAERHSYWMKNYKELSDLYGWSQLKEE